MKLKKKEEVASFQRDESGSAASASHRSAGSQAAQETSKCQTTRNVSPFPDNYQSLCSVWIKVLFAEILICAPHPVQGADGWRATAFCFIALMGYSHPGALKCP